MVPEISLTPQLETRVKKRFGMEVCLWHSKITKKIGKKFGINVLQEIQLLLLVLVQVYFFLLQI